MRILFCKVASMKWYKGVCDKDESFNGGSFVKETGQCMEDHNFDPIQLEDGKSYCLGFVETKRTSTDKSNPNMMHIEKIDGCEYLMNEQSVEDVLVIWCATTDRNQTAVMGWYKHATVYRQYQSNNNDEREYNILAYKKDVVLLPRDTRDKWIWNIPVAKKCGYGFGSSMVWYAQQKEAQNFICKLARTIDDYQGENWVQKYPQ